MEPNADSNREITSFNEIPFYEQEFSTWKEEDREPDLTPAAAKLGLPDSFSDQDIKRWRDTYYIFATSHTFPEPTEYCYPCAELSIRFAQDADRIANDNWWEGYKRTAFFRSDWIDHFDEGQDYHPGFGRSWWVPSTLYTSTRGKGCTLSQIYLNAETIASVSERVFYESDRVIVPITRRLWVSSALRAINDLGPLRTAKDHAFVYRVIAGPNIPPRYWEDLPPEEYPAIDHSRIYAIVIRHFFLLILTYAPDPKLTVNTYRKTILSLLRKQQSTVEELLEEDWAEPFRSGDSKEYQRYFQDLPTDIVDTQWDSTQGESQVLGPTGQYIRSVYRYIQADLEPRLWRSIKDGPYRFSWWQSTTGPDTGQPSNSIPTSTDDSNEPA